MRGNFDRTHTANDWSDDTQTVQPDDSKIGIKVEFSGEHSFSKLDAKTMRKYCDKTMTGAELVVQVNKNFPHACVPIDVLIQTSKIVESVSPCCSNQRCIGTAIIFIQPKKSCQNHSLAGTIWVLLVFMKGQILLRSTQ